MMDHMKKMEELIDLGGNGEPHRGSWGMYSYCDVNDPCGGGAGGFYWFESKDQFVEMAKYVCWIFPSEDGKYDPSLLEANHEIIERLESGKISLEDARGELNDLLAGLVQVDWWGTLDDLIDGQAGFPREIRSDYWSSKSDENDAEESFNSIPQEEEVEFIEWLKEYV